MKDFLLTFGRYKGHLVSQVMDVEPEYIGWAIKHGAIKESELDKGTIETALDFYEMEQAQDEARFETEHGDWGQR